LIYIVNFQVSVATKNIGITLMTFYQIINKKVYLTSYKDTH